MPEHEISEHEKYKKICLFLIRYFESKTRKNISKPDLESLNLWLDTEQSGIDSPFSIEHVSKSLGIDSKKVNKIFRERLNQKQVK